MTMPPRKPSDDPEFWDGIAVTQANRRFLFDHNECVLSRSACGSGNARFV